MKLFTPLGDTMMYCFGNVLFRAIVPGHEDINPGILAMLEAERKANPSRRGRSIDGWRSGADLMERGNPSIDRLAEFVRRAVGTVVIEDVGAAVERHDPSLLITMWANIVSPGHGGAMHCHMGGGDIHYSGVYYVRVEGGDPAPNNGVIEFVDPRCIPWLALPEEADRGSVRTLTIQPRTGMLLVFPAWLNHQVRPWHSAAGAERVSLAFNVSIRFG